jgi:hypothetical protein
MEASAMKVPGTMPAASVPTGLQPLQLLDKQNHNASVILNVETETQQTLNFRHPGARLTVSTAHVHNKAVMQAHKDAVRQHDAPRTGRVSQPGRLMPFPEGLNAGILSSLNNMQIFGRW